VGDSEQEVFLGRDIGQRRIVSEQTAQLVDSELKRLLDESYALAGKILEENRDLLDRLALALLERETLDREDVELLAAGKELPPVRPRAPEQPTPEPTPAAAPRNGPATGPGLPDFSPSVARGGGAHPLD
jgi:cell division protease FtsH